MRKCPSNSHIRRKIRIDYYRLFVLHYKIPDTAETMFLL